MPGMPLKIRGFRPHPWENDDGPRGAGNTTEGLTHSSDLTREGLAMKATRAQFASPLDLTNADEDFRRRFWSKVAIGGPNDCWEWTEHRKANGYGQFVVRKGVFMTASRVALTLSTGPLAAGIVACHRCDNPPCCNPAHLFAGTSSDNALDSVNKGRARRATGERNASSKLTADQVRTIRDIPGYYGVTAHLARLYGVSETTIRKVRAGERWRTV